MTAILTTTKLSKTYCSGSVTVEALKPIDLTITKGEFVSIIGASGSGKSTLLHLLAGLDQPSGGTVKIGGNDIYKLDDDARAVFRRRHIGFIFQFFNLIPVLTAEENVTLPLLLDRQEADSAFVAELLEVLGLDDRTHHLPDALSGGQQQRVAIARALVNRPDIVFADEPTGNLDTQSATTVLDLLRDSVHRFGQTLVMVTHDSRVAAYANRIITLKDGCIISDMRE